VARVEIYYAVDPDPRSRFWRSISVRRDGAAWIGALPVMDTKRPLFAFANVLYRLPRPAALPRNQQVNEVCLSTLFHEAKPAALQAADVKPAGKPDALIENFKNGFRDWYTINGNHRTLWQHWTRKVTDPKWRGSAGARLALTIHSEQPNVIGFVLKENTWRGYRGKPRVYTAEARLKGRAPETVTLALKDFRCTTDGAPPASWAELDELGLVARHTVRGPKPRVLAAEDWRGAPPVFIRLEWLRD
jgi:hypothetical protein